MAAKRKRRNREKAESAIHTKKTEGSQVEEALRKSETQLRTIIESLDEGLVIADLEGNLFHWNPAAVAMHGFGNVEECRRKLPQFAEVFELSTTEDGILPLERWPLARILRGETLHDWEVRIRRLNSDWQRIFSYGGTLARDQQDRPLLAIVTLTDITERKKVEEALRESQKDLSHAQEVGQIGSWRLDVRKNVLSWSDENHRMFGIPKGTAMTYETFLSTVHPEDREYVDTKWKAGLAGEPYDIEHRIVVDGQVKWVREKAYLEFDTGGGLLGGFGITQDITHRKLAEEQIANIAKFPAENPNPVLRISGDGTIMYSNTPGATLLERWSCEIGQKAPQDWCKLVVKALKSRGCLVKEVNCGDRIHSYVIAPVPGEGYVNLYGRDVTKQKQYERELRRSKDELEMRVRERTAQLHQQASLLELANDAIIVRGVDDEITFWNQGAVETYGWTKEQSLGKKTHTLLKTEFSRPLEGIEAELNKNGRWEGELAHTRSDGTQIIVASRWVLQRDDQGSPVSILQINRDITERRQAQETVKAERKRFEDVLEMMPAYAVLLTLDYHVTYANHTFRKWFGDDNGKPCYEFLFDRKEPCETCETYTVLKTGKSHFWAWTGPNGRNYDIYDYPFTDADGSPLIMEIGVDVTEHKQAQTALRSASFYSRGLLEAALDPLVTISPEGKITDVNKATEMVTGLSRDSLIGTDFSDYFTEPEKARQGYKKVLSEGQVKDYPLSIRHVSGRTTDVLYNATVYKNEAGQVQGVFAAARDVTERRAAEERQSVVNSLLELFAREESRKAYLDSVVEVIRDWSGCEFAGIRIRDNEGNIPYESYTGFEDDFLSLENALHLDRDNCVCIRAILENPAKQEQRFVSSGGSFYCNDSGAFLKGLTKKKLTEYRGNCIKWGFKSISVIPIRYRDKVLGVIHLADFQKDKVVLPKVQFIETIVSPLIGEAVQRFNVEAELEEYRQHLEELVKQGTKELARSNRDLEQFAYVASHDLQEPLRAVAGFVGLLRMQLRDSLDAKKLEYMNFATDGVQRMQALINGLLEYSRVGTRDERPEPTNAKVVLDRTIMYLGRSIKESGAKITADDLPMVCVDSVQLAQLFQNLIGNAIKFRGERAPQVHIGAIRQDNAWQFAVADNGIGIEPQYSERIFQIFQRLHSRDKYSGTGIGLAICRRIVERHGGRIWVESKPGHGSTFYFTIPDKGDI